MSQTWGHGEPDLPVERISLGGWLRVLWRGLILGTVTFGGLGILMLVRLIERPFFGQRRPVTPFITQFVCKSAFVILRIRREVVGEIMQGPGAIVSNHVSWLDIFTLNAAKRVYFVAKAEVAAWPAIGWLARATGTAFIRRDPREAKSHVYLLRARLGFGHKLLFFPEGTSTDGKRVLPFKPTLFAAFLDDELKDRLWIQPVTLVYTAPQGQDPRLYGWWGDQDFGPSLLLTLARRRQGRVTVVYHQPLRVLDFTDRKALARAAEAAVKSALPAI